MKKVKILLLFLILVSALNLNSMYAQEVSATAKIDTNNVLIGDQFKLKIEAKSTAKTNIVLPVIPDTLGKLEVVSRGKIDTVDSNGSYVLKQNFTLTAFDTGWHQIPAFTVMYDKKGMPNMYPAETQPLYIRFNTVKIDTTQEIKDIKPPLDIPFNIWDYIDYILIVLAIIVIGFGGYYIWKKFKKKKIGKDEYDPKIPPHVIALEALRQLEAEKLWQKGKVKDYYIRLTEIIRLYLERRFTILALEMISDEIIAAFKIINLNQELISKMSVVFNIADLVKFAKHQPIADENSLSMNYCIEFVNQTAQHEIPTESTDENNKESLQ